MAIDVCVHIPEAPPPKRLTLPGAVLEDVDILNMVQPVLAPLMPIFQIIDAIVAVFQCVQAIKDAISSLDATKMASCIPELVEKVSKLLRLVPQLSVPLMVVDLLGICVAVLGETRSKLVHLQVQMNEALRAIERGRELDDPKLPLCVREVVASPEPRRAASMKQGGEERRHRERVFGIVQAEARATDADAQWAERQQAQPGSGHQPADAVALAA